VDQETRLYDPDKGETRSMRSKEEAHDYRYFPCPDLLPLEIEQAWVDDIAARMPELPDAKKARYLADYSLTDYDASVLTAEKEDSEYFEATISALTSLWEKSGPGAKLGVPQGGPNEGGSYLDVKFVANWIINNLFGRLKKDDKGITESPMSPQTLAEILILLVEGTINNKIAKELFEIVYVEGGSPAEIVNERGMKQVTDTGEIERALDALIAANPEQVEKAKVNAKLAGWFTGQVLKATGGKANPAVVNQMVAQKLGL
jgi:aspartyl-tRNA(Asn)/glutamyl-tRNA(Gln) amidotransferase subunit B